MDIKANLEAVQEAIARACRRAGRNPGEVLLIAVSKTVDGLGLGGSWTGARTRWGGR